MAQIIGYDDLGDPIYDTANGEADRSKENNSGDLVNRLTNAGVDLGIAYGSARLNGGKKPAAKAPAPAPAPTPKIQPWMIAVGVGVALLGVLMLLMGRRSGGTA